MIVGLIETFDVSATRQRANLRPNHIAPTVTDNDYLTRAYLPSNRGLTESLS